MRDAASRLRQGLCYSRVCSRPALRGSTDLRRSTLDGGVAVVDALVGSGLVQPDELVVRFGLWPGVTEEDVERVLTVVPPAVRDLSGVEYRPAG